MAKAGARKRAPGGGAKPRGPFAAKGAQFQTRITQETRDLLDAEAKVSGLSVSQVAEKALREGLELSRERKRPGPTKALLFLIGKLADGCSVSSPEGKRFMWNEDRGVFDAFQCSLTFLIEQVRSELGMSESKPSGLWDYVEKNPEKIDPIWRRILESPERLGERVFERIWLDLVTYEPTPIRDAERVFESTTVMAGEWSQYSYTLDGVRRELNIKRAKQ